MSEYSNEYDSQGDIIKRISYNEDGSMRGWEEYIYDVEGDGHIQEEGQQSAEATEELESLLIKICEKEWVIYGGYGEKQAALELTNVTSSQLLCVVWFKNADLFEFSGTIDSMGHAILYDSISNIRGELSFDEEEIVLTLEDKPNHYFDRSLSEFYGGLQFVFRQE